MHLLGLDKNLRELTNKPEFQILYTFFTVSRDYDFKFEDLVRIQLFGYHFHSYPAFRVEGGWLMINFDMEFIPESGFYKHGFYHVIEMPIHTDSHILSNTVRYKI